MAKARRSPAKAKAGKSLTKKKKPASSTSRTPARRSPAPARASRTGPSSRTKAAKGGKPAAPARRTTGKAAPAAAPLAVRMRPAPPPPTPRRSTYADAVAAYDRGMRAFHARAFGEAQEILASIITQYPEEKELHERVQMYLNVCARHVAPTAPRLQTVEERLNAATLAINDGRPDDAIGILKAVAAEDAANDSAAYLLGVAFAIKEDLAAALAHLDRAIRLNPDNRDLIRKEADLEGLRQTDQFETLLNTPVATGRRRRP